MIAERLRRLAADPELRARLGSAGREASLAFGRERMIVEREVLYLCLSGRGVLQRAPHEALERVGRGGHREQSRDGGAPGLREALAKLRRRAQLAQAAGEGIAIALGEDEPAARQL